MAEPITGSSHRVACVQFSPIPSSWRRGRRTRHRMFEMDEIRKHVLALKARGVRFIGHRAMLARCLDEVDALQAALRDREALLAQRDTAYEQVDQAQAVVRELASLH